MTGPLDISKLRRAHQHFLANHAREVDKALEESALGQFAQRHASRHGGFTSRTGNLVRRTHAKVVRTSRGKVVKIRNNAPYAHAQDGGSGLHGPRRAKYVILPRRKFALRFVARDGSVVFTRKVMHPGVPATRFLYNATDATARATRGWLLGAMKRAASRF